MDLKSVQQQLKANIAKHQTLMMQLKQNPQEKRSIQTTLLDVQKQIAQLGSLQQQIAKARKPSENKSGDVPCVAVSTQESNGSQTSATSTQVTTSFTRPLLEVSCPSQGNLRSSTEAIKAALNTFTNNSKGRCDTPVHTVLVSSGNSAQLLHKSALSSSSSLSSRNNILPQTLSSRPCSVKLASSLVPTTEPIIISSQNIVNENRGFQSVKTITAEDLCSSSVKTCIALGRLPTAGKTLFVKSSMNLRAPLANGSPFMLVPTGMVKSSSTTQIRLSAPFQRPQGSSSAQMVRMFNVESPLGPPKCVPSIIPPTVPTALPAAAFQKLQLVRGKNPNMTTIDRAFLNSCVMPEVKPAQLNAVVLPQSSKEVKNIVQQNGTANCKPTTCCVDSPVKQLPDSPIGKNSISQADVPAHLNQKISFLGQVDLIPREKAERMRNRRYKRRRAVAHPVYSGGLYVSSTAGDSSRRVIPMDFLDAENEVVPVKRPRGRPRGSTNKRSVSPQEPVDGVEEEYLRILQRSKSSNVLEKQKPKLEEFCAICQKAGEVLMCDTCSKVYHMACLSPPLKVVPTGMWYCDSCKEKFRDSSSAPSWPGIKAIVHSYFAYNSQREETLANAQEKQRVLRARRNQLEERKKLLTNAMKEKLRRKGNEKENFQRNMVVCENLTTLIERIRCAVNRSLDTA